MRCPVQKPSPQRCVAPAPSPPRRVPFLLVLFLLPLCGGAGAAESGLPDCRAVERFAPQSGQAAGAVPGAGGGGGACRLRPGAAAVMLLGSAEAPLQSPMRTSYRAEEAEGGEMDRVHAEDRGEVMHFLLGLIARTLRNVQAYPWKTPAALERFFFVRQFQIRFELENSANLNNSASRARFFNTVAFDRIRLISFAPLVEHDSSRLVCDYATVLSAQRTSVNSGQVVWNTLSSLSAFVFRGKSKPFTASSSTAQRPTGAYVMEELGPYRSSGLWLPPWLSVWFGRRPFAASEALVNHNEEDSRVEFVFSAELPAVTPVCMRLSVAEESGLIVRVEESLAFDGFWLQIILLLCFLRFVQPWVEESQTLQIFVAGLGGVVVICCFVVIFVLRSLQDMTLGKVGLLTLLVIGGFSSVAEGIVSALGAVVSTYVKRHEDFLPHTLIALLFLGVSCGLFAKFLWASYLSALTQWTMRLLQMGVLLSAALQNREATFIYSTFAFIFRPSFLFRFIIWCSRSHTLENSANDPQEVFPRGARREVPYAQPLCVEGLAGSTRGLNHEEKLHLYGTMGEAYTQQALTRLAARVRQDPGRYAARLQDPKGITRWANSFN